MNKKIITTVSAFFIISLIFAQKNYSLLYNTKWELQKTEIIGLDDKKTILDESKNYCKDYFTIDEEGRLNEYTYYENDYKEEECILEDVKYFDTQLEGNKLIYFIGTESFEFEIVSLTKKKLTLKSINGLNDFFIMKEMTSFYEISNE